MTTFDFMFAQRERAGSGYEGAFDYERIKAKDPNASLVVFTDKNDPTKTFTVDLSNPAKVPQGEYTFEVKDDNGHSLGNGRAAVGAVVLVAGQSNAGYWAKAKFTNGGYTEQHVYDIDGATQARGMGYEYAARALHQQLGADVPICLVNASFGGTSAQETDLRNLIGGNDMLQFRGKSYSKTWDNRVYPNLLDRMKAMIAEVGGSFEFAFWNQGEADARNFFNGDADFGDELKSNLTTIFKALKNLRVGHPSSYDAWMAIQSIGNNCSNLNLGDDVQEQEFAAYRDFQKRLADDLGIKFNKTDPDFPMHENLHYSDPAYAWEGLQLAALWTGTTFDYDTVGSSHRFEDKNSSTRDGAHVVKGTNDTVGDTIKGGGGADLFLALAGNDLLYGGAGDDVMSGGNGDDRLRGQDGNDNVWGDNGNDNLTGGAGNDYLNGGWGNDRLYGGDDTSPRAADGNDYLVGGDGDDLIYGGGGNDIIDGDDDRYFSGRDTLYGGDGNDVLRGGKGDDEMWGGAGRDVFAFSLDDPTSIGVDRIHDFQCGVDKIDFSALRSKLGTSTFDWSFDLSSQTLIVDYGAYNPRTGAYGSGPDGIADFRIKLDNVTAFAASDIT